MIHGNNADRAVASSSFVQSLQATTLLPPTVTECRPDLLLLDDLRRNVARVMQQQLRNMNSSSSSSSSSHHQHHHDGRASSSSADVVDLQAMVEILKEYAVHLNAFCDPSRGFPVTEEQGKIVILNKQQQQQPSENGAAAGPRPSPPFFRLEFPWKIITNDNDNSSSNSNNMNANNNVNKSNYLNSSSHDSFDSSNHSQSSLDNNTDSNDHGNYNSGNNANNNRTNNIIVTTTAVTTTTVTTVTTGSSLTWERANVYWNLAALCVIQAQSLMLHRPGDMMMMTKPAWSEMGTLLQTAACWIQHLRCHVLVRNNVKQQQHQRQHPPSTTAEQEQHDHDDASDDDDDNNKNAIVFPDDDWLSPRVLVVVESFLAAASQCAAFEWFQLSKSQHLMSAKLAAASIPFYAMAEEEAHAAVATLQQQLQTQQQHPMAKPANNATTTAIAVTGVLQQWANALRAWGMWMSAVSEYHQALVHETKRKTAANAAAAANNSNHSNNAAAAGKPPSCSVQQRRQQLAQQEEHLSLELARLDIANRFGTLCQESLKAYCNSIMPASNAAANNAASTPVPSPSLESRFLLGTLVERVQVVLPQIRAQQLQAQQEEQRFTAEHYNNGDNNNNNRALVIPSHEELPEIPPQTQVKLNSEPSAMAKLLPPLPYDLFKTTLNETARRILLDTRLDWEEEWLPALEQEAEEVTEEGRRTLRSVNLPRSLTLYRQERAGGGIPQDLWLRVEQLQQENRITRLQQELWDLKDVADQASALYKGIHSQLQDDLTMDQLFREQNPTFEGHDVEEIQKTFRLTLENYAHLMESAEKGDALLFKRLELLNTDPKYRLLQFRKTQLDRLIPSAAHHIHNNSTTTTQQDINVEELSRYLVELSLLFQQRDDLLDAVKKQMRTKHAACVNEMIQTMQQQEQQDQNDEVYLNIVASARRSLEQDMVQGLRDNMNAQSDLLERILEENEYFCRARGGTSAAAAAMPASPTDNPGDRSISIIEDALEEMDQLDKHLKEGRAFYNVVIPKLEKLQQQVGDVSARLTIDRCDFDDKARRKHQEADDARMAASMSSSSSHNNSNNNNNNTDNSSPVGGMSSQNPPSSGYCTEPPPSARYLSNEQQQHQHHQMRQSSNSSSNFDSGGGSSSLSSHSGHGSTGGGGVGPAVPMASPSSSVPHHGQSTGGGGGVRVDDEKVASLVAMDFDPDRVVAALKKHDNNVEQAINDLLSG
jgi:uncharacterized membrane protein YgcG